MDSDVERLVWEKASEAYGDSLGSILNEALAGYNRSPGFDELTRLYPSTVGDGALAILTQALSRRSPNDYVERSRLYVELRSPLRSYLTWYLLRRIVHERRGIPVLRDALRHSSRQKVNVVLDGALVSVSNLFITRLLTL